MDLDKIIAFECDELDEEQTIELFQGLINTGACWRMQGFYGRFAHELLELGLCTEPS